jgi:hypothetical protein
MTAPPVSLLCELGAPSTPLGSAPKALAFRWGFLLEACARGKRDRPARNANLMLNITVTQAGAQAEDPSSNGDPATIIFARIRVLTPEGQALLNLSLEAAEELAKTLQALLAPRSPPASSAASDSTN